jgi:PII-like signaling protein
LHNQNFFGDLWDEIIEVSTYGPSERKMLKARRAAKAEAEAAQTEDPLSNNDTNDDDEWLDAFRAAKDDASSKDEDEFDGYALRDLLVGKWGVPLDVDFQRISTGGATIYCTILPVIGFGSSNKSRHNSELEYLMHLQGVIEILNKYNQLDGFLDFVESTTKVPKQGTDSVPFRLQLTETQIQRILPNV